MPAHRLEITLSDETWERLDAARAHEPRASFVKRALDSALGAHPPSVGVKGKGATPGSLELDADARSASTRAPVEKEPATEAGSGEDGRVSPAGLPASSRRATPSVKDTWAR